MIKQQNLSSFLRIELQKWPIRELSNHRPANQFNTVEFWHRRLNKISPSSMPTYFYTTNSRPNNRAEIKNNLPLIWEKKSFTRAEEDCHQCGDSRRGQHFRGGIKEPKTNLAMSSSITTCAATTIRDVLDLIHNLVSHKSNFLLSPYLLQPYHPSA
jgi:hypothetical protein